MSNIVIATLDNENRVISFMEFDSEARLEAVMKKAKESNLKVRTISRETARKYLLSEETYVG